ncbi:MAG: hypothetical protein VX708_02385 [Candidatus Thermoplasmatota archaeon]|nr:hypothetical protein [Candidatus Thermoplasmatota archaeon]
MIEGLIVAFAILVITPGWAVALVTMTYWIWRRLNPSVKER